jgi:hypothetical protein
LLGGRRAYHPEDIGGAVLENQEDEEVVELVEDEVASHEGGGVGVAVVRIAIAIVLIIFAFHRRDSHEALQPVEEVLGEVLDGHGRVRGERRRDTEKQREEQLEHGNHPVEIHLQQVRDKSEP